ncbi:hypothetical protein QA811_16515 [Streptomyces sp. B21-102]
MAERAHDPAPLGAAGTRHTSQRFAAHEDFREYVRLRRGVSRRTYAAS